MMRATRRVLIAACGIGLALAVVAAYTAHQVLAANAAYAAARDAEHAWPAASTPPC